MEEETLNNAIENALESIEENLSSVAISTHEDEDGEPENEVQSDLCFTCCGS